MIAQRKDESLFEYWVSFWPTAPLFGVRWRFEGVFPTAAFLRGGGGGPRSRAHRAWPVAGRGARGRKLGEGTRLARLRGADEVVERLAHAVLQQQVVGDRHAVVVVQGSR